MPVPLSVLDLHDLAHGEMGEVGQDGLGLGEFFGFGVEFFDGVAEEFVEAAQGFGIEGDAHGTDGDVKRAALAFGDVTEVILNGKKTFGAAHFGLVA